MSVVSKLSFFVAPAPLRAHSPSVRLSIRPSVPHFLCFSFAFSSLIASDVYSRNTEWSPQRRDVRPSTNCLNVGTHLPPKDTCAGILQAHPPRETKERGIWFHLQLHVSSSLLLSAPLSIYYLLLFLYFLFFLYLLFLLCLIFLLWHSKHSKSKHCLLFLYLLFLRFTPSVVLLLLSAPSLICYSYYYLLFLQLVLPTCLLILILFVLLPPVCFSSYLSSLSMLLLIIICHIP